MRIKEGYLLRQVADTWVIVPLALDTVDFNGMITLNDSAVLLWRELEKGADTASLVRAMTAEYSVSQQQAREDIEEFLRTIDQVGCLIKD